MQQTYDAVVVGSGATGGWVARQLTEAGLQVAVLEAGRRLNPAEDYSEHTPPHAMPLRGRRLPRERRERQPVQSRCYQCDEYANHLFIDDGEHPYTTPAERRFDWIRGRHVGGKSIMWARQSYRLSDYDLQAASRDGFGEGLAAELRGARAVLRPGGAVHRHQRPAGGVAAASRR